MSCSLLGCTTLTLAENMYKKMNKIEPPKVTVSNEGKYHLRGPHPFLDTVYIIGNYCGIKEELNYKYYTYHFLKAYNNLDDDYLEVMFPVTGDNVQLKTVNKRKHLSECDKMPALLILLDHQHAIQCENDKNMSITSRYYENFKSMPLEGIDKQTFINQIENARYPFAVELFLYDCKHGDIALVNKGEDKLNQRCTDINIPSKICEYRFAYLALSPLYLLTIPVDIVTLPLQIYFVKNFRF